MSQEVTQIKAAVAECLPKKNPILHPDYTEAEVQAIRAMYDGKADERQQRMVMDYILRASGKDDMSYRPGDTHDTAFAEGKRWVGNTLIWMLKFAPTKTNPDKISARNIKRGTEHG